MIKIVTLSLALSLLGTAGFAGGVQDAKLKFIKKGPTITLQNKLPPVAVVAVGVATAAVVAAVLNSSGASTTTSSTSLAQN